MFKSQPAAPVETCARFKDFHGFHAFRWIVELLGLLGLLILLEGVFGFLALLERGLNHVVPHAQRQDGSVELQNVITKIAKFPNLKRSKT